MDEMGKMMAEMNEKWNKLLKDRMMKEADYMENRDIQVSLFVVVNVIFAVFCFFAVVCCFFLIVV